MLQDAREEDLRDTSATAFALFLTYKPRSQACIIKNQKSIFKRKPTHERVGLKIISGEMKTSSKDSWKKIRVKRKEARYCKSIISPSIKEHFASPCTCFFYACLSSPIRLSTLGEHGPYLTYLSHLLLGQAQCV